MPSLPGLADAHGVSWRVYQEYDNYGDNGLAYFANFRGIGPESELYRRACDGDIVEGCSSLGWATVRGAGVAPDRERGIALLRKGCAGGNTWGCDRLQSLGVPR